MLDVLTPTMIDYTRLNWPPNGAAAAVGQDPGVGFSDRVGSDLASLTTRAEQRGDDSVINGQKVSDQLRAVRDRCVLLTRTGGPETPNHEAITAFFVDLDTQGVTVRPLRTMHDVDEFCEVYFDDVVVPADRMLGGVGDGWRLAMDLLPYERSTCFWQRIAYLYSRFDALIAEVKGQGQMVDSDMGEAYLALHTLRCRSMATQHRLGDGEKLGPDTSIDKVLLAGAEQRLYDTARDLLSAQSNSTTPVANRVPVLQGSHHLRRHSGSAAQHHRAPPAGPREGVIVAKNSDLDLLEDGLRKTMLSKSGPELDAALTELGWAEMLSDMPDVAVPMVFRLLGETGSHASVLNDVVLQSSRRPPGGFRCSPSPAESRWFGSEPQPMKSTNGYSTIRRHSTCSEGCRCAAWMRETCCGWPRAAGHWPGGWSESARAMLSLARQHALDRVQFGKPIASFQAVRHRLAETLVAIEGAEATLGLPGDENPDLTALLAKAAAGKAALTAAKHCQQVLGGIGFTEEHDLGHHVKRVLVLDGLLGSSRELTRKAGAGLRLEARPPASPTSEVAYPRDSLSFRMAGYLHVLCEADPDPLFARQPEQSLGDDVALDFRRATRDGAAEGPDVALEPAGPVEVEVKRRVRARYGRVSQRLRADGIEHVLGRRLRRLGTEQFQNRKRSGILVAAGGPRQRDRTEQSQRLVVHHQPGIAVTIERSPVRVVLDELLQPIGIAEPQHVSFMAEGSVRDAPALVEWPDQVFGGHARIVEEHLVEVEVVHVARRRERPANHAGQVGGNHQRADALVPRRIWIGSHERQQHIGVVRAGRPYLLPVDDENIAGRIGSADRPRSQRRQIRARTGLAHPERGRLLGPQDRHRPLLLLLSACRTRSARRQ